MVCASVVCVHSLSYLDFFDPSTAETYSFRISISLNEWKFLSCKTYLDYNLRLNLYICKGHLIWGSKSGAQKMVRAGTGHSGGFSV